jgi:hypothetical protein
LRRAWDRLFSVFRRRVEAGEILLAGVCSWALRDTAPHALPAEWAAELTFDPAGGAVFRGLIVYTNVTASRAGGGVAARAVPTEPKSAESSPVDIGATFSRATLDQVALLDRSIVALLLERHAEHVRLGLRVALAQPGKASVMALVASMMKHRAARRELLPTLAEEADWLEEWARKVAPSWDTPCAKTISNKLRSLHRKLVAEFGRSTTG